MFANHGTIVACRIKSATLLKDIYFHLVRILGFAFKSGSGLFQGWGLYSQ